MYISPRGEVMFGDIFEGAYLFDAHLDEDAIRLGRAEFPPKAKIQGTFYSGSIPVNADVVLAHGRSGRETDGRGRPESLRLPGRAILISDDCHILTAYGDRPGREHDRLRARGRLMFAPIYGASDEAIEKVRAGATFGRFALPAHRLLGGMGGIAELRRTFLVAARAADPQDRIASLDDAARRRLEMRWNAFACRRGPEASLEHVKKLGLILSRKGEGEEVEKVAAAVGQALVAGWELEGHIMRDVAAAQEHASEEDAAIEATVRQLRELAAASDQAAGVLAAAMASRVARSESAERT